MYPCYGVNCKVPAAASGLLDSAQVTDKANRDLTVLLCLGKTVYALNRLLGSGGCSRYLAFRSIRLLAFSVTTSQPSSPNLLISATWPEQPGRKRRSCIPISRRFGQPRCASSVVPNETFRDFVVTRNRDIAQPQSDSAHPDGRCIRFRVFSFNQETETLNLWASSSGVSLSSCWLMINDVNLVSRRARTDSGTRKVLQDRLTQCQVARISRYWFVAERVAGQVDGKVRCASKDLTLQSHYALSSLDASRPAAQTLFLFSIFLQLACSR